MRNRTGLACLLLLGLASSPALGQAQLEWKFKEGDTFFVETVTTFNQKIKIQGGTGKEITQAVEQTSVLGFKVNKKEADGTIVLKQTIEGLMHKNNPKDAASAPVPDDKIQGAVFTITLNPKLEIVKFEGYPEVIAKLTAGATKESGVETLLRTIVTEEAMKRSAREALAMFLPDKPVKTGDTWEKKVETPLGPLGSMTVTNHYKYDGKGKLDDKEYEKISFVSDVKYQPSKAEGSAPFQILKGDLKAQDARGTVYFDTTAGRLVQQDSEMNLKGNLTLSVAGQNLDAEVDQTQKTKVSLSPTNPIKK